MARTRRWSAWPSESVGPNGVVTRQALVEAKGISKRFGSTQALSEMSLEIRPGEIHALLGRNGAGKSTLVSILTGLVEPDAGSVSFDGRPAPSTADRDGWQRLAACVYQYPTVVPDLSIAENLVLGNLSTIRGGRIDWSAMRRRAVEALGEWGVDLDVDAPAGRLHVDQRQIVEITRALLLGTRFIILDEPTAGLTAAEVQALFERIAAPRRGVVGHLRLRDAAGGLDCCPGPTGRAVRMSPSLH